jgi:hypothetical protein
VTLKFAFNQNHQSRVQIFAGTALKFRQDNLQLPIGDYTFWRETPNPGLISNERLFW